VDRNNGGVKQKFYKVKSLIQQGLDLLYSGFTLPLEIDLLRSTTYFYQTSNIYIFRMEVLQKIKLSIAKGIILARNPDSIATLANDFHSRTLRLLQAVSGMATEPAKIPL
jgi:hypothetical protein